MDYIGIDVHKREICPPCSQKDAINERFVDHEMDMRFWLEKAEAETRALA